MIVTSDNYNVVEVQVEKNDLPPPKKKVNLSNVLHILRIHKAIVMFIMILNITG